tara:strand:- start:4326 stop:5276 length:951 start_codon:yes stop_codon:yes gene_type:complete
MPNILKRPMFRKGGSASDGVGITSGLRKNYSEGTPKNLEYDEEKGYSIEDLQDAGLVRTGGKQTTPQTTGNTQSTYNTLSDPSFDIIRKTYEEMMPTRETTISDFLTALGATSPKDATKLQTFGQVLSQAGTTATGLRQQREDKATTFKTEAIKQVVKNLTAGEKDQLIRRAKTFARLNNIPEDQAINMFLSKMLQTGGSDYLKDYSPEVRARQLGEKLAEDGFTSSGSFQEQITAGNIWQLWESKQLPQQAQETLSATTYPNDLVVDPESETAEFNPDKKGINQSRYVPNKSYVNPADGGIYLYEGDGQFKKIYP